MRTQGHSSLPDNATDCIKQVVTHIVERLAEMVADGELDAEYINVESEHSAMSACIGAEATGVRTFTATSSQGLALMHEMLFVASGMRLPIVMGVANRALSAPINIWNDWSDTFASRDSGWIQLYCESSQEIFDTVIQAYRIAEDKRVLLPVMVCLDGYYLSHTVEPVELLDKSMVKSFLPDYKPEVVLDPKNPVSQGTLGTPEHYQEFKKQQQEAMEKAKKVISEVNKEFGKKTGRSYGSGLIEVTNPKARYAILTLGTLADSVKHLIAEKGWKDVGLVRLKALRPFPKEELEKLSFTSIGVVEKDLSFGNKGVLYTEVKAVVDTRVSGFIGGLGGRDITLDQINQVISKIRKTEEVVEWIG